MTWRVPLALSCECVIKKVKIYILLTHRKPLYSLIFQLSHLYAHPLSSCIQWIIIEKLNTFHARYVHIILSCVWIMLFCTNRMKNPRRERERFATTITMTVQAASLLPQGLHCLAVRCYNTEYVNWYVMFV